MYPDDDWRLKLLVVIVWCLDTLHQGFITHSCYIYLITFYAQPAELGVLVLSLIVRIVDFCSARWLTTRVLLQWMTLVSGIICFLVQCFLVLRVWKRKSTSSRLCSLFPGLGLNNILSGLEYSLRWHLRFFFLLPIIVHPNSEPEEHPHTDHSCAPCHWRVLISLK